jgi:hypothetical protein
MRPQQQFAPPADTVAINIAETDKDAIIFLQKE